MSLRERLRRLGETTADQHAARLTELRHQHPEAQPILGAPPRQLVTLIGEVKRSLLVPGASGACHLEVTISDGTASAEVRFLGRRQLPGVEPGRVVRVTGRGMPTNWDGRLRFTNPRYDLL